MSSFATEYKWITLGLLDYNKMSRDQISYSLFNPNGKKIDRKKLHQRVPISRHGQVLTSNH